MGMIRFHWIFLQYIGLISQFLLFFTVSSISMNVWIEVLPIMLDYEKTKIIQTGFTQRLVLSTKTNKDLLLELLKYERKTVFQKLLVWMIIGFLCLTIKAESEAVVPVKQAQMAFKSHLLLIDQRVKALDERFQSPASKRTLSIQIDSANINDQAGVEKHLESMSDWIGLLWFAVRRDYYQSHRQIISNSLTLAGSQQILKSDLKYIKEGMQRWSVIDGQLNALLNNYVQLLAQRAISLAKRYQAKGEKRTIQLDYLAKSAKENRSFDSEEERDLKVVNNTIEMSQKRTEFIDSMLAYLSTKSREDLAKRKVFGALNKEPRLPIDEPEDSYRITSLNISDYGWWKKKTTFDQALDKIDQKIDISESAIQALEEKFLSNDKTLNSISKKMTETKSQLKPLLEKAKNLLVQQAPEPYRSAHVKYRYHTKIIDQLENQITMLEDKASKKVKEGRKSSASQIRQEIATLFEDLSRSQKLADDAREALQPYFKNLTKQTVEQNKQVFLLKDVFSDLQRRQQRALDERQSIQQKQVNITQKIHRLHQQKNSQIKQKIAFLKKQRPVINSIVVQANGRTVYLANVHKDPKDELKTIDDLVQQSKAHLDKIAGQYNTYRARFEDDFSESRVALGKLGGATGAIMQTAYLQAGAESLFYFIDIAEQWAEGGPIAALSDAIGKAVVAWTSEQPAFQSADEQKVLNALFGNSEYAGAKDQYFSLSTLQSTGIERGRTQAYMYAVRDKSLNGNAVKLIEAARSNDGEFSKRALEFGEFLDDKGRVRESLTKGKDYLEHLRNSKDALKGVIKEYAKDLVKNYLKESAKSLEESAWAEYFIQDMIARKSFQFFQKMRNEYWQALDIYRDLVSAREKIEILKSKFDAGNQMLIAQSDEIEQNSYVKVSIYGPSDLFSEDVSLGDVKLQRLNPHQYYWHADQLNSADKGEIGLSIVQQIVEQN